MSDMQCLGRSTGDGAEEAYKFNAPPVSVCEQSQVHHRRNPDWPFLYSYEGDAVFINKATPKSKYQEAEAVGFAEF